MKLEIYKPTKDDWYGNFTIQQEGITKLVRIAFYNLKPYREQPEMWRICIWGTDDFGLEKDLTNKEEALQLFYEIISWPFVNQSQLKNYGFYNA